MQATLAGCTNTCAVSPASIVIAVSITSVKRASPGPIEHLWGARVGAQKLWLSRRAHAGIDDGGYAEILGTWPQSIAYGLNDSPAGLAAWIVEKFYAWSDCDGDLDRAFTKDELLTTVMIYWVTQTANSSARLYYETRRGDPDAFKGRVEAPTALAVFPAEGSPPRSFVERIYNLERWTEMPAGGHFAALEQPTALVEDIRAFFRRYRDELAA